MIYLTNLDKIRKKKHEHLQKLLFFKDNIKIKIKKMAKKSGNVPAFYNIHSKPLLFYCNRLGQVSRLIDIAASHNRYMIGK